ncbi:MAG TPA: preprotein translocase subunit SecG [Gammaproteobacteria bacterium]|nr:preprotein translocase subunit SecG [Gammaproteobacteria bacterium]
MFTFFLVIQLMLGIALIVLILLQQGKGADMGAAFGSGSSSTVFGARGSGNFFSRTTGILATAFFINSLLLSSPLVRDTTGSTASVTERVQPPPEQPARPSPDTDLPDLPGAPAQEAPAGQDDLPR